MTESVRSPSRATRERVRFQTLFATSVLSASLAGLWGCARSAKPGLETLMGRWVRPDGGYIVEIKNVAKDGAIDAAYFNPDPIHVARAEAFREAGALKVFIELRDVNYPGSTYTLTYNPVADRLEGIYYQAAIKQDFEVYFERSK
ncbi:MAG: hypothetical protein V1873_02920 [Verrucomicrobiota bacterium]